MLVLHLYQQHPGQVFIFIPLPAFSYPFIQPFFSICLFLSVNFPISVIEICRNNCNAVAWMQRSLHFPHCKLSPLRLICVCFLSEGAPSFHKELDMFSFLTSAYLSRKQLQTSAIPGFDGILGSFSLKCFLQLYRLRFIKDATFSQSSPAFETTSLMPRQCSPAKELLRALSANV